eukprot:gnl/Chilomastix_cuspidata/824.p4 GENE.gnl/Chilomastix_cuspidata/824~~gnl/Chilomastix_cuspidata/824.p4  ORF type:complete len:406 (+),score=209.40 gnl/Chilomastix_cuspidata/824:3811-5028(+)
MSGKEVLVAFATELPDEFRLPTDAVSIPLSATRESLSLFVNESLGISPPRNFDFTLGGHLIHRTLNSHVRAHRVSTETTLEIVYDLALNTPRLEAPILLDDWVSSIARVPGRADVYAACYDGAVRCMSPRDGTYAVSAAAALHTAPAKAIASVVNRTGAYVVSGGLDTRAVVSRVPDDPRERLEAAATLQHPAEVMALASALELPLVCSGAADGGVRVWDMPEAPRDTAEPAVFFGLHKQPVVALCFAGAGLLSGSLDHTVRRWDLTAGCERTVNTPSPVHALAAKDTVVTGHTDFRLRQWDMRAAKPLVQTFRGHRAPVTAVALSPSGRGVFASASLDGCVRIWDPRSAAALYSVDLNKVRAGELALPAESSRVDYRPLSLLFASPYRLLAGGSDCRVRPVALE